MMIKYICEKCGCEQHCRKSCTECRDCPDCACKECDQHRNEKGQEDGCGREM